MKEFMAILQAVETMRHEGKEEIVIETEGHDLDQLKKIIYHSSFPPTIYGFLTADWKYIAIKLNANYKPGEE